MELYELVVELKHLERRLTLYEEKYGVLSEDFYQALMAGELSNYDQFDESRVDFSRWKGLYETWLRRKAAFPHPEDPSLASTFPHHKHVPPDMKRNRIPAPGLSFERPNLPAILDELQDLLHED